MTRAPEEAARPASLHAVAAVVTFLVTAAIITIAAPLLPVDETRYLTVAWEMQQSGNWLVPTLNGALYSHKPPLLFWLINGVWALFGSEVWAARAVVIGATTALLFATYRLGQALYSESREAALLAVLVLAAMPALLLYGPVIMFDMMLGLWVVIGMLAIWRAGTDGPSLRTCLLLGLAIGLAVLTKGPVILVHLLPPMLLVSLWRPQGSLVSARRWAAWCLGGIAIGAAIGLGWAIPAAISGGPEFAEMIFWRQSADRIATSFAHDRPFWFYIPVVIAFLFPLLFWRPIWRAASALRSAPLTSAAKFLLCWIVPTFLLFSLFRGKQPHYLLPLLPGVVLLVAETLRRMDVHKGDALLLAVPTVVLPLVIAVAPYLLGHVFKTGNSNVVRDGIGNFEPIWFVLAGALALVALAALRRTVQQQALAVVIGSALFVAAAAWECHRVIFKYFDLAPIARALEPLKEKPLAFESPYHGELGYMARLARPMEIVSSRKLVQWLAAHPDGAAVVRHRKASEIAGLEVIYSQPYRNREFLSIVRHAKTAAP